eukprot:3702789-Rhodomonas_salina.1
MRGVNVNKQQRRTRYKGACGRGGDLSTASSDSIAVARAWSSSARWVLSLWSQSFVARVHGCHFQYQDLRFGTIRASRKDA